MENMKTNTKKEDIERVLNRGVEEVIVEKNLRERLLKGDKLRIKLGIDPTGSFLHLGHAVVLKKLKDFQDLGHQVIFLIGDFTAKIGDPTGRSAERKPMTKDEIKKNMESYQEQAGKILDMEKVEVRYNSEWLAKLDLKETIILMSKITYSQMAQRSDFKERIKKDIDLSIQEFLYPAMQGYDSVELKADVELGGTDQKFNLLMGRQLQKKYGQKPQDIITCPLLEGLDGVKKMSKSIGNYISLTEDPMSMYGKIMSIPDNLIVRYFELCTELLVDEIKEIASGLKNKKINPRDVKMKLALEVVKIYHGTDEAKKAQESFTKTFQKKELPEDIEIFKVKKDTELKDVLVENNIVPSSSEFRRLIKSGAVDFDNVVVDDIHFKIKKSGVVRVGKKTFIKLEIY